jgi:hypothetical protein
MLEIWNTTMSFTHSFPKSPDFKGKCNKNTDKTNILTKNEGQERQKDSSKPPGDGLAAADFRVLAGWGWRVLMVSLAVTVMDLWLGFDDGGWATVFPLGLGTSLTGFCEAMAYLDDTPS